jgi:hypothetical protein
VFIGIFGEDPLKAARAPVTSKPVAEDVDALAEAYLSGVDVWALRLALEKKIRERS